MNVKTMLVMTLSIIILLWGSNETWAGDKVFLDQIQSNDIGESDMVNSAYIAGQTFQVNTNGSISSIALKLDKTVGETAEGHPVYPGDLIVEIRTSIADMVPSEEVLASATVPEADIEEGLPQWYEITFPTKPYVIKKSVYSFVVRTTAAEGPEGFYSVYYFGSDEVDSYENGMLLKRKADDYYFNWMRQITWQYYDAAFELFMVKGKE